MAYKHPSMKKIVCAIAVFFIVFVSRASDTTPVEADTPQSRFDKLLDVIRNGNDHQRAQAILVFANIDDPRVVPVLIGLLKDKSDSVKSYTAQKLAGLADIRSADALAEAVNDSNGNVRQYAAEGLAKIGGEQHVPALVGAVMNHLPDSKSNRSGWPETIILNAIGKISLKAPSEVIDLLKGISGIQNVSEAWWRIYESAARCLGQIGDEAAYPALSSAHETLCRTFQDYKTWYSVRKSLGQIDPQNMPFNRPAADILYSIRGGKITEEYIESRWIQPIVKRSPDAATDLEWALKFEGRDSWERKKVSIKALGEIGGPSAAKVLRTYIHILSDKYRGWDTDPWGKGIVPPGFSGGMMGPEKRLTDDEQKNFRSDLRYLRLVLPSLLEADPTENTVEEIVPIMSMPNGDDQKHLMREIVKLTPSKIPPEITVLLCRKMLESEKKRYNEYAVSETLVAVGGEKAGQALSLVTLQYPSAAAIKALGKVQGYDAVPALIEASKKPNAPLGAIAEAMGTINDKRALPALEAMAARPNLNESDQIWVAAALARMGKDYDQNAAFVRGSLPQSCEAAKFLHDKETVETIAGKLMKVKGDSSLLQTLEAIGTKDVLDALNKLMDREKAVNPHGFQVLSEVAARVAGKLGIDSDDRFADTAVVAKEVLRWFHLPQQVETGRYEAENMAVKKYPDLARTLWKAEVIRRLDLAAKQEKEDIEFEIPDKAVRPIGEYFNSELVPVLERIAQENRYKVSFAGKDFYNVRSDAAKILTEKTGREHTFVDVDGRTHPGGWNPTMKDSENLVQ
jgi:HEAT repeat protein